MASQLTYDVDPSNSRPFTLAESGTMWVQIKSDKPVFPSGVCPASLDLPDKYIPVTFYRAEGWAFRFAGKQD